MTSPDDRAHELARHIAERLGGIEGVVAVVLGGSRARGTAAADSDVDIGIYYRATAPPDLVAMRALARRLDSRADAPTDLGEWGPWVNGGAWLEVDGWRVDWIYRELERVSRVADDGIAGNATCDYYLGHPHGFHNHIYLAEIYYCHPLFDPHGVITALKQRTTPYPAALRQAIVEKYLFDAGFMLDLAKKPASRGDVFHATGCLFRGAAALVQVVFALNETYFMNEKGALAATRSFARCPQGFASRVETVLSAPGEEAVSLRRSIDEMESMLEETEELAPPLRYRWRGRES